MNHSSAGALPAAALPSRVTSPRVPLSPRERLTLLAMCLGTMMTFLQITAMTSALGPIQVDLHVPPATLVWVPSAYALPVASLVLGAAQIGNRWGRKRSFSLGVVVLSAGALVTAGADTTPVLVAAQLLSGVGGALVLPSSLAVLGAAFPDPHRRTEVVTAWAASSGIGLAIGPLVAGALLARASWHAVLLPNVALGVATLAVAVPVVAESRQPGSRLDPVGLALGSGAVAALVYGLIEGSHAGYSNARVLAAWIVALVAAVAFVAVELRAPAPMLDVRLFRSASFSAVMVIAAVSLFGFTGVAVLSVLFDEKVKGLTPWAMAWQLLALFGVYVVVAFLTGRQLRRTGFRLPLTAGLVLGGLASLGLATVGPATPYVQVWPWLALFGTACGLAAAPATAAALVSVPHTQAGMASGAVNASRQLGSVLGSSLLGALLTSRLLDRLPRDLDAHRVPAALRPRIVAGVAAGADGGRVPSGALAAIADAFTSGVHAGLVVNGVVWLLAAVLAALLVRNRPHQGAPPPPPQQRDEPQVSALQGQPSGVTA